MLETGSRIVEKYDIIPHIIKIDVEGAELDVLKGFGKYIKDVKAILFEYSVNNLSNSNIGGDDLINFLLHNHFQIYSLDDLTNPIRKWNTLPSACNLVALKIW